MTTPQEPTEPDPYQPGQPPPPPPPYGAPAPPPYGTPAPPPYGAPPAQGWGAPMGYGPPPPASGYATWGDRVLARLIDALVILPGLILVFIGAAIGSGAGAAIIILGYLVMAWIGIWNEIVRQGRTGQTIGKVQMHIKLIREADGQVLGVGFCFVRNIAHIIDGIPCYIGYLWPLWDAKKQTFADKVCGTIEVKV